MELQVHAYREAEKLQETPEALSREALVALLLSKQVCVWAECYRKRPE